jgi:hypothetical protein
MSTRAEYGMESFRIMSPIESPPPTVEIEADINGRLHTYKLARIHRLIPAKKGGMRLEIELKESLTTVDDAGQPSVILTRDGKEVHSPLRKEPVGLSDWSGSLIGLVSVLPKTEPLVDAVRPVLTFLSSIRYYAIDEPCEPAVSPDADGWVREKDYQEWVAKYNETKNPSDSVPMRIVHMWQTRPDSFAQLIALLGTDGLDLIRNVVVDKWPPPESKARDAPGRGQQANETETPRFYTVQFMPTQCGDGSPRHFGYNDLSSGTRRIIRILVSLLFDASEVMLLEHPEDGIHTGLVRKLVDLLKINVTATQVIMTSHSSTILNELEPSQIRMVSMEAGVTHVRSLRRKEIKSATAYMAEDGTLSEFLELAES